LEHFTSFSAEISAD
jgi:hypothetical protein